MSVSAGFLELLQEVLTPLGHITVRRMFGGAGLYCDGQVFALVDNDTLYFKTDEAGRTPFAAEGMGPFAYDTKNGPGALMSYWRVPERLLDEGDELCEWARRAIIVARQAQAKKKPSLAKRSVAKKMK
jgi:DNA transformation protein